MSVKIVDYKTVSVRNENEDFDKEVMELINKGYALHGNLVIGGPSNNYFVQVLVKTSKE